MDVYVCVGGAQPSATKAKFAGCWLLVLLTALVGPLILFSDLNPVTDANFVTSVSVELCT
jgi:low affinity Fe/Cu permease